MGEEQEKKPDPKIQRKKFYRRTNAQSTPKKEKYKAPTDKLEHLVFTSGTPNDAANFTVVQEGLAEYIGSSGKFKPGTRYAIIAVADMENPSFPDPPDPQPKSEPPTMEQIKEWKYWEAAIDKQIEDKQAWESVKVKVMQLLLQHTEPSLKDRLKATEKWTDIKANDDVVGLMKLIRSFAHDDCDFKQGTMAYVDNDLRFYLGYQRRNESLEEYRKNFKARADVIEAFGGDAGYHKELYLEHKKQLAKELNKDLAALTSDEKAKALASSKEEYKAALFIRISNNEKYAAVKRELDNDHLKGSDNYPRTMDAAMKYLQNYKPDAPQGNRRGGYVGEQGVAFGQPSEQYGPCHGCGLMGHVVKFCRKISPEKRKEILAALAAGTFKSGQNHAEVGDEVENEMDRVVDGIANVEMSLEEASIESAEGAEDEDVFNGTVFHEASARVSMGGWVNKRVRCGAFKLFLDSCATNHSMCNLAVLERIHTTKYFLRQNCNAGSKLTNRQGYWNGIPFWVNETGIANLLSLPKLEKCGWVIKYETGGKWVATSPEGQVLVFKKDAGLCDGMPYLDMSKPEEHIFGPEDKPEGVSFIETVRKNMEGFTREEVERATMAREAMAMMAHPPLEKLKQVVSNTNLFGDIPFNATDLTNSNLIFGPDRGAIRGRSVRQRPHRVRPTFVQIPVQLYEKLRDVTLTADVMFCNGLPFFVSISRDIKLITVQFLPSRTAEMLVDKLRSIMRIYRRGGY